MWNALYILGTDLGLINGNCCYNPFTEFVLSSPSLFFEILLIHFNFFLVFLAQNTIIWIQYGIIWVFIGNKFSQCRKFILVVGYSLWKNTYQNDVLELRHAPFLLTVHFQEIVIHTGTF